MRICLCQAPVTAGLPVNIICMCDICFPVGILGTWNSKRHQEDVAIRHQEDMAIRHQEDVAIRGTHANFIHYYKNRRT